MADIRLLSLILPAPAQGVAQPGNTQNSGNPSGNVLSTIAPGTLLSGFIINRDASGNPILRTDQGDITFASDVFLKIGSEVVIRLQQQAGQAIAKLLTVNGQAPQAAQNQSVMNESPEVIIDNRLSSPAQSTNAAPNRAAPETLVTLAGKIITPQVPGATPGNTLPAGTQLQFKLVQMEAPAPPPAATSLPASPTSPRPTTSPAPPVIGDGAPGIAAAQIIPAARPPVQPAAQTAIPNPLPATLPGGSPPVVGQQLQVQFITRAGADRSLLQTPLGTLELDTATAFPHASKAVIELEKIILPQAAAVAGTTPQPPLPFTELASSWKTAQDVFSLLLAKPSSSSSAPALPAALQGLPVLFAALLQGQQPVAEQARAASFIAALNTFAGALKSGDVRSWLGRATAKWLEENHEGLFKKFEGEFMQMSRQFTGTQPGQWQALFYPMAAYGEVETLRFFVKRDKPEKDKDQRKKKTDDTRFVVEMELSQMGGLQMDGFVRRGGGPVQFDMVIRSRKPLPDSVQNDILAIYTRTGEATGYLGQLTFQTAAHFPVNPMEELALQPAGSLLA